MIIFIYFTRSVQNYIYTSQFYAIAFQNISDEKVLRLIRLREAIEQQRELHAKKMKIAEAEEKIAILKLLKLEEELKSS